MNERAATISRSVKELSGRFHNLDRRLSTIEAILASAFEASPEGKAAAIGNWIDAECGNIIDEIERVGSEAADQARIALLAQQRPLQLILPISVLAPLKGELTALIDAGVLVESAAEEACDEMDDDLLGFLADGEQVIDNLQEEIGAFAARSEVSFDELNDALVTKISELVPDELARSFDAFDEFITRAESLVSQAESVLDGELAQVVTVVAQIAEIVEPVLPLLEPVADL